MIKMEYGQALAVTCIQSETPPITASLLESKRLQCDRNSRNLKDGLKNPEASAEILPTHTAALFQKAVKRAAELLRAGELVALPTETVYGLAANALDAAAVGRIFEAKGRPAHNPIIVHVADIEMARACVSEWPVQAEKLARAFWPGPLTLVLPRAESIPDIVTAGGSTVGLRWPSHPFIQAVIRECGFPLAAPSANPSNQISPTNAEHVSKGLGTRIKLIVDGGQSQVGIESTVLDISVSPARVLRPGMIREEALQAALPAETVLSQTSKKGTKAEIIKSPGQLKKHYSPKARLEILSWENEPDFLSQIARRKIAAEKIQVIAHTVIPSAGRFGGVSVIPHDAEAFARAIYAELHRCDEAGAELIIVEALPESSEWQAIADRLKRAAT
ncbi:L-threonylcarbamoyladenylate synthase [Pedosphaera parvula]|uniref:Threonylcarbamoyl-AMP synthase n=1 Tax=Pedosphaera parvula (strain Ellin514) TaxID=320771 RepID=B9XJL9_PEDPL|nr:L-threonylcarbamoyladenylate synthase [Pedosphaera parvula]EEF59895.1 Sua5/YciO/YrdC/YwlC family protein [Pedosphaera parvula Ellin514]